MDAPAVLARRRRGAGGHHVLRRGRAPAPPLLHELDLSKTCAGILTAAYPAGTFIGALPSGWLATRWGVKPTLLLGLSMLGLSSLGLGGWRRSGPA
jgi:MFS family permease